VNGGHALETSWGSLGFIAVAAVDNSWRTRQGVQQEGIVENGVISPRTDYGLQSTQNDAVVNGLLGFGAKWDDHTINLTNLYIHTTTKEARSRAGNDEAAGAFVRDDFTEWFERELFDTQLRSSHTFGRLKVDWRGSYAESRRDAPYEKGIRYRLVGDEFLHNASQEQNFTRFSFVEDEVRSAGLDFAYTLEAKERQDTVVSVGAAWMDNERSAEQREFRLLALDGALPIEVQRQRADFLLSDFNIGPGRLTLRETTGAEGAAAYTGELNVKAAYAQVDAEFIPLLRTSFGVRYEDAEQEVIPLNLFSGPAPVRAAPLTNDYWLPAACVSAHREPSVARSSASSRLSSTSIRTATGCSSATRSSSTRRSSTLTRVTSGTSTRASSLRRACSTSSSTGRSNPSSTRLARRCSKLTSMHRRRGFTAWSSKSRSTSMICRSGHPGGERIVCFSRPITRTRIRK
jgi:hypothetical protein